MIRSPDRPTIVLAHRYFRPDTSPYGQLLGAIADSLSQEYDVHVLTMQPSYARNAASLRQPALTREGDIVVRRLPVRNGGGAIWRLVDDLRFARGLISYVASLDDVALVMTSTMPPVLAGLAALAAARRRGALFLYHMMDIYPEVLRVHDPSAGGVLHDLLLRLDTYVIRNAARVIVLSDDMKATIASRGLSVGHVTALNNFELPGTSPAPVQHADSDTRTRTRILFAGNIGKHQGLELVLEAAGHLDESHLERLELMFLGDGKNVDTLKRLAAGLPEGVVRFEGRIPVEQAKALMRNADLNLVTLAPGMHTVAYPSKATTLRALGAPILAVVEAGSQLARDVRDSGVGLIASNTDVESLASALKTALEHPEQLAEFTRNSTQTADQFTARAGGEAWRRLIGTHLADWPGNAGTPSLPAMQETRTPLRYRWSHQHPVHRAVVRTANTVLASVPMGPKYAVSSAVRRSRYPYSLLHPDSIAVQVGAPADTLRSGRSRGMHFALRTQSTGRTIIIEPDAESRKAFGKVCTAFGLKNVEIVPCGAWSKTDTLTFYIDPAHPATNFTEGTVPYSDERKRDFTKVEVPVRPLDEILAGAGVEQVDVLSITTNGAERQILQGAESMLGTNIRYVCLARTEEDFSDVMGSYGYELLAQDDRGFTYFSTSRA